MLSVTEAWNRFSQAEPLDATALNERRRLLDHQIERDGITHNVHAEGGIASRPWSLELLPLVIEAADWAVLEAGVRQRAALLQAVLHDIYGPRQLLTQGHLPGALLHRHPGYLRPLHGLSPALGLWLHVLAFDLTRDPAGRWCVLAQRTQAPSGLGYTLHNRLLVARSFPRAFEQWRVRHIAPAYRLLLATLQQAAAHAAQQSGTPTASPRVVLWTPGPFSETHFEQAYLARYLGLPLVEGGDLTVRDQRLYLKTLHGLEPVHGVLRRLDEDWCDPLELRADSHLGVPGLLQVLRAGHVAMANAPGTGCLETPALHGFLPGMARALLGEDLLLPSVDSWWCGEAAAAQDVLRLWPALRLRRAFPEGGRTSRALPADEEHRRGLIEDPEGHVAQRPMPYAPAPVWTSQGVQGRPAMVRVYAIADGTGGWQVLPGGMTRVAREDHGSVSLQRGGASLDTWVLAAEGTPAADFMSGADAAAGAASAGTAAPASMAAPALPEAVPSLPATRLVPSRTGENLFWLGRYTERVEQALPLIRWCLDLSGGQGAAPPELLHAVTRLARQQGLVPAAAPGLAESPRDFELALLAHAFDTRASGGAQGPGFGLQQLLHAAGQLRERLSPEHWGHIRTALDTARHVHASTEELHAVHARQGVITGVERLGLLLGAITGAQTDRMTRDQGWRLLALGRLIERLILTGQRLQVFLEAQALSTEDGLDALLDLSDSVITFRARHQRRSDLAAVADVLVFDDRNPRAVAGILRRLRTELGKLPGDPEALATLARLLPAEGAGLTAQALSVPPLAQQAQSLADAAARLADAVAARYFTPAHALDVRL